MKSTDVRNGGALPYRCQGAFVEVAKWFELSALDGAQDVAGGVAAFLDCGGGYAGDGLAIVRHGGQVTDYEHVGSTRDRQVGVHLYSTRAIDRGTELCA